MSLQLENRWREDTHHYVRWSEDSRQVIRLYKPRLQQQLVLSPRCGHLKGNGGVKAAVRFAQRLTNHYAYVARFDIRHYYESIDHRVMLAQLRHVSPDVFDVVQDYLCVPDPRGRNDRTTPDVRRRGKRSPIKIARYYGHKKDIENPAVVVLENSFHGRTLATLSATGSRKVQAGFEPLVSGFVRVPFDDLEAVRRVAASNKNVVAILAELVQGEGGVCVCSSGYLQGLRDICDKHGWLLMLDEVQTGIGRSHLRRPAC